MTDPKITRPGRLLVALGLVLALVAAACSDDATDTGAGGG